MRDYVIYRGERYLVMRIVSSGVGGVKRLLIGQSYHDTRGRWVDADQCTPVPAEQPEPAK